MRVLPSARPSTTPGGSRTLLPWLASVLTSAALAQPGYIESEPNDEPADANPITGPVAIYGSMPAGDQDGFLLTISDDDARKRWGFELTGIPGALTVVDLLRVEYADNGRDVEAVESLMKMGTRDGLTPSVHRDQLLEPGEYIVGIAHSGGPAPEPSGGMFRPPVASVSFGGEVEPEAATGTEARASATGHNEAAGSRAYLFTLSEGRALNVRQTPPAHATQETALEVRPGQEFAAFNSATSAWYSLTFDERTAAQRWDLEVRAPIGRELHARLIDESSGTVLVRGTADSHGLIRFADLAPEPTTWFVELTMPEPGFIHAIRTDAAGLRIEGEEAEPNDQFALANRVDLTEPLTGRVGGGGGGDYFAFSVDETLADRLMTLRLDGTPAGSARFCLLTGDGVEAQCRTGTTPIELPDLMLGAGGWGLYIAYAPAEITYSVSLQAQGPIEDGVEAEPNDSLEFARGLPSTFRVRGRFSGRDADFYKIVTTGDAQLWRFQVVGDELFEVGYYNAEGTQKAVLRAPPGQRRVRLDDLFLLPGTHYLRVEGRDSGDYNLIARAVGPPNPNGELEPNDPSNRQRLAIGQTRVGLLADPVDQDHYRFFLGAWDHIRLTVQPPADGIVAANLEWYGQSMGEGQPGAAGEPVIIEGLFPPGDYGIALFPRQPSDAEYTLRLERLPRFSCPADCEPNGLGEIWLAAPLPPDLVLIGRAGEWRDPDYYALPMFTVPTELLIRSAQHVGSLSIGRHTRAREVLQFDAELGGYRATIPAGDAYRLIVDSGGTPYRLELEFPGAEIEPISGELAAELLLTLDADVVSAYRTFGQQVTGELVFANTGTATLEIALEAVTSDYRWDVALEETTLTVPGAGRAAVPVRVTVPADAWADRPVRISARARDAAGRQVEAWQEIAVTREAEAVAPTLHWPIRPRLRGGFNAAWAPLGGVLSIDRSTAQGPDFLNDGLVFPGHAFICCTDADDGWADDEKPLWTLDLPGDAPVPVAGIALNHFGPEGAYRDIRTGVLLLSADGESYTEVLRFEALPVKTEQAFALPEPIQARFAQLRIDSTFQERGSQRLFAAEWKVILTPGFDLSAGAGFNIADPLLGGHVVWDGPPEANSPTGILADAESATSAAAATHLRSSTKEYVIGFYQNRAARIERIEWRYPESFTENDKAYDRVTVAAALESPVGPWQPIGEMDLSGGRASATLTLSEPAWARFVRLTAHKTPGTNSSMEPGLIQVWEQPTGENYLSVLTEWGSVGQRAFYEQQAGVPPEPELTASGNVTRATAQALELGALTSGEVSLRGPLDHWYRVSVPPGHNTLTLELTGDPTVRTVVMAEDAAGEPIGLRRIDREQLPQRYVFEAVVEPGGDVWLKVAEPPRNVIFSWDTSASVEPYIPFINNSLVAFSSQVVRGREAVNLMPFDQQPLLREWYSEQYALQTMLNDYRRSTGSSSAERTLKMAAQELRPRQGTRAIVVITDAETPHDGEMWMEMQTVQPRIFSMGVAGARLEEPNRLRDWASVNGGHYTQLVYEGEMEVAFDRATTLMQRPAGYTLKVESEFRELPGPGRLSVVPGASGEEGASGAGAATAAVELILDASGSMLQRMEGERRINVAKEVLISAVRELIPAGAPVALRVFGHREPDACRTDLEIPLGPLDPEAAATTIAGIQAMNLARTPIADSLAAVETDLGGATGGAIVVLVTDGEETCDGNPEAVIASLRDRGIQVSLNIVGFAIDDTALAAQFEAWATLGGGRYFAANDPGDLSEALEVALRVPFTVYDAGGNEVAVGEVGGDPVALEQGVYRVVVNAAEPRIFDAVEVPGESDVELEF